MGYSVDCSAAYNCFKEYGKAIEEDYAVAGHVVSTWVEGNRVGVYIPMYALNVTIFLIEQESVHIVQPQFLSSDLIFTVEREYNGWDEIK